MRRNNRADFLHLVLLWEFNIFRGLYITQSNIYDEAFIAKIVSL